MEHRDSKAAVFTNVAVLSSAILLILACSLLMELRAEVHGLKESLATKSDLVAMKTSGVRLSVEQDKCTRCHTERRYAGEHRTKGELMQVIRRMEAEPDTLLTARDVGKIHASLTLLKCTRCHSFDEVKHLVLLTDEQQMAAIRRMQQKPESAISPDEVRDIRDSFQLLVGF